MVKQKNYQPSTGAHTCVLISLKTERNFSGACDWIEFAWFKHISSPIMHTVPTHVSSSTITKYSTCHTLCIVPALWHARLPHPACVPAPHSLHACRPPPYAGMDSLDVVCTSRVGATQRAGRAGRTRPGKVSAFLTCPGGPGFVWLGYTSDREASLLPIMLSRRCCPIKHH